MQDEDNAFHMLFKVFTRELWMSVASHVIDSNKLPNPKHLEEAMSTWTPQRIEQILGKDRCCFLPSTHGLVGKYPKNAQSTSFVEMRTIFFPALDVPIRNNSIWNVYAQHGAYIDTYHGYLRRWPEDDITRLNDYLDGIFSNLQCLPASKPPDKSGTVVWSAVAGKIQFLTNSSFYRIEEVGGTANIGASTRPQTSSRQLERRIQGAHGRVQVQYPRSRARTKSIKTRNKRNPPINKHKRQRRSYP